MHACMCMECGIITITEPCIYFFLAPVLLQQFKGRRLSFTALLSESQQAASFKMISLYFYMQENLIVCGFMTNAPHGTRARQGGGSPREH